MEREKKDSLHWKLGENKMSPCQKIAADSVQPFIMQFFKAQVPTLPLPPVSASQTDLESDLECEMETHGGNLLMVSLNRPERWV